VGGRSGESARGYAGALLETLPSTVRKKTAARISDLSESTIKRRIADGTLKAKRDRRVWLIDYKSLMRMINENGEETRPETRAGVETRWRRAAPAP
jgi:hypothetical protein